MVDTHNILKRWHDQTQNELNFARSMRDQWQREVERLEGMLPKFDTITDPPVPKNEVRAVHPDGPVECVFTSDDK